MFAYLQVWTGLPRSTFFLIFVLTLASAVWMHWTVHRMLDARALELRHDLEEIPGSAQRPEGATL